jgi:hypothetical protein
VCLVIFSSISIPFAVAFDPEWSHTTWYKVIDLTTYGFYFIDMIFSFRTSYFSVEGEEREAWPIAKNYLTGTFLFDFVTGIPFSYFIDFLLIKVMTTLRVVRLVKLRDIVNNLYVVTVTRAILKLSLLIFSLVLVVHILACLSYIFIMQEKSWIPPTNWIEAGNSEIYNFYNPETTIGHRYLIMLYYAMLSIAGNEIGPRDETQLLAVFIALVAMMVIMSIFFGEVIFLV